LKKAFPYIIGLLVLIAIVFLTVGVKRERTFDERLTFRKSDKIPYGTFVAYDNLQYLFPGAVISRTATSPEYWDSTYYDDNIRKAIVIITPQFIANETEMNNLLVFAQKGNDVFISTKESSNTAQKFLKLGSSDSYEYSEPGDSVTLTLDNPPFPAALTKTYPGRKFQSYLYKYDSSITSVIGRNHEKDPVFIHLVTGKGNVYLHVAPIAFTNYFLLHKKNIDYYNEALSVIHPGTKRVVWDEYFLYKLYDNRKKESSWLSVLFKYPPFRWALLTAIFTILVYGLLEMRRKQRYIPAYAKPGNDSLDFVKTIGRLYYEKNDHRDLSKKMGQYFLEHVRNRYKISTAGLGDNFVKSLHYKSGYNESELKQIVSFISFVDSSPAVSDSQLAEFHGLLEAFYKLT
jgi:hypothetical protein